MTARTSPSILHRVQRLFTSGRLARRFAFLSLMLGTVLVLLIGASLYLVSSRHLTRQHHGNIDANATLVARQTEGLLNALVGTVSQLAGNSVLATALVDSAGKETYLLPFLRSFSQIGGVPVSLVFTDFEGTPIADNGQGADGQGADGQSTGNPPMEGQAARVTPSDMAWLRSAIATGRAGATVVEEDGVPFLLAAEMLIYSRTASPEGALLYKTPLNALVLHPEAELLYAGAAMPPVPPRTIPVRVPLAAPEHLASLDLTLLLKAPEVPTAAFQSWVLPAYGVVALASLMALYFGSRAVGSHMTRSLRELERLSGTIASDGFTGQRARIHGDDEVSGLSRSFNLMLDHIATIQQERELRAAEEITIQRTLAERAEQARADAENARNEAERARQEAVMALMVAERANAAKTHFLAAASHDLRQPVQSLVLLTSALATRLGDHPAASLVGSLETSIEALCRLLDAILDVSKLDAGTVSPNVQAVSLGAIFERLDGEYRLRASEKGIAFRSVPNSLTLSADPTLLERIIRNLVENALRYTDQGRILLGCRRGPDGGLRIQVHDTGIGIPQEHLDRIFHEFYQVSNPARDRGKGLGLGLAIVDRLARLLGYRVHVASWPGKGSCFTLEIDNPRHPLPVEHPVETAEAAPSDATAGVALVIDDDPLVREGLTLLIEDFGWRVLATDSAPGALRALSESGRFPDLVIADYRLEAGATGLDAIRAVEAMMTAVPAALPLCVVLTGDTAPARIVDAQASGYRILHKPISAKEIALLLNEAAPSGQASGHAPASAAGRPANGLFSRPARPRPPEIASPRSTG